MMRTKTLRSMVGPIVALAVIAAPTAASAQNHRNDDRWTSTRKTDAHLAHGITAGKISAMQHVIDKDVTQKDLEKILPLLQDLRDARHWCEAEHDAILADMMLEKSSSQKMAGDTRMRDCENRLAERRRDIWNTISEKIGSDKADGFRRLVEPMSEDYSRMAYTNERLQRMETIIEEWDRLAAARIAAAGGTPPDNSGVRPASVETTTTVTTTTTTRPGFSTVVTTPAALTEHELIHIVQDRIVANEIGNSEWTIMAPMHRDLTSADVTFLREGKLKVWH